MTQAYNLSQLANNLNTAGQLDATDGLVNAVPVANGGTGASTVAAARSNLNVPTRTGGDASGTWAISISGNAETATSATSATSASVANYANTAGNGGVTSVNGSTGAVSIQTITSTTGAAPYYGCRAWVNFDGTGAVGTNQTIRASGNISSVFKNNTGDYTINFLTTMPDANYATIGRSTYFANNEGYTFGIISSTASSVRIYLKLPGITQSDGEDVSVAIFR